MKQFNGFPDKVEFTPLPSLFFSALLPQISDMAELKTTLHVLPLLYQKRGYPRFITYKELLEDAGLMGSLREPAKAPGEILADALKMAVERGTVIHTVLDRDGVSEDIYFLNTEPNRQIVARLQSGELSLPGMKARQPAPDAEAEPPPDIFTLYEQNIGMLTPMKAEELRDAEKLYPGSWIRDAIKEAVSHEKRNWSYIAAILRRWSAEGKSDGAYQRDSKADPNKYIKGKYGHMVRR